MRLVRSSAIAVLLSMLSAASYAQVVIAVNFGPPALPVYEQPLCPGEGYLWAPGYWAFDYDYDDYYWVPGTWVLAPEPGLLWTPPYWGWNGSRFLFYDGYWGPQVGFYGGIAYGFGYFGSGYEGGYWRGRQFYYNRYVNNVNVTVVHNVYNTTVVNTTVTRVSYNGGEGGITARPTPQEESAARERHIPPTSEQTQHVQAARSDPQLRAAANHGKPAVAATERPGAFRGHGVIKAKQAGAPYRPPANRAQGPERGTTPAERAGSNARPGPAVHPNDLPPIPRPPSAGGNSQADRKYQQQQEKLYARQEQERQKLEQKQEQEHAKLGRQNPSPARQQQMEQRHQRETEQLQQRHQSQQQQLQGPQGREPHR